MWTGTWNNGLRVNHNFQNGNDNVLGGGFPVLGLPSSTTHGIDGKLVSYFESDHSIYVIGSPLTAEPEPASFTFLMGTIVGVVTCTSRRRLVRWQ